MRRDNDRLSNIRDRRRRIALPNAPARPRPLPMILRIALRLKMRLNMILPPNPKLDTDLIRIEPEVLLTTTEVMQQDELPL